MNELKPALEFYRLASQRDDAFQKILDARIKKENAKATILVAGGFHARGIEENLRAKNYSYAFVVPKIDSLAGHEMYWEMMQGEISYKRFLTTTFYDAFAKAA